jgi:hypothetical protein
MVHKQSKPTVEQGSPHKLKMHQSPLECITFLPKFKKFYQLVQKLVERADRQAGDFIRVFSFLETRLMKGRLMISKVCLSVCSSVCPPLITFNHLADFHEIQHEGHVIECDLNNTIFNPVASTILNWWTFKPVS